MNQPTRRPGLTLTLTLTLALVFALLAVALAPAQGATTRAPHLDPPATYTTTIVVEDLDAEGHVVASQTIKGEPQPLGTRQTFRGDPRPFLDSGSGGQPSGSGCRVLTVTNKTTTTLGFTAFKFITEVHWCWNLNQHRTTLDGVDVRVADVDSQYRYRGLNNAFNADLPNGKRVYRQGYFENCLVHYGCINAYYPSNDSRVYDNGAWYWITNG
jgi:hypothetical protein